MHNKVQQFSAHVLQYCSCSNSVRMGVGDFVQLAIFLSCLCGFLWQVWDQADKFISSATTVAVSRQKEDEVKFPTIAFCDQMGFTERAPTEPNAVTSYESYMNSVVHVDVNLTGLMDVDGFDFTKVEHESVHLPTVLNGMCKIFKLTSRHRKGSYVNFLLNKQHSYHMFILVDGEERQLVTQYFFKFPPTMDISDTNTCVDMELKRTLQILNEETCNDYDLSDAVDCIHKEAAAKLRKELECMTFLYSDILPGFQDKSCAEGVQANNIRKVSLQPF